ncbi:LysR family transcriptional regulator [Burkholderia oklahomensis]|uniref:LysR family transcriptional regulator n=1 Tax=Burkholderia oklahomensis TaxID=342113 RepID=UPI0034532447
MELRHLRCFLAVAEELHFARAAEKLHIEQCSRPCRALSRSWRKTWVCLFVRTTRSTRLTRAGNLFLEHVPRVFAALGRSSRPRAISPPPLANPIPRRNWSHEQGHAKEDRAKLGDALCNRGGPKRRTGASSATARQTQSIVRLCVQTSPVECLSSCRPRRNGLLPWRARWLGDPTTPCAQ